MSPAMWQALPKITSTIVGRAFGIAIVEHNGERVFVDVEITKDEIGKEITFYEYLLRE